MLSARELSITLSTNPLYWCWKPLLNSRFAEGVELIMVCWLEIKGKINTRMLSPRTTYGAYLIVNLAGRAFGLDSLPSEVSVKVGDNESKGIVYIRRNYANNRKQELEMVLMRHRVETLRSRVDRGGQERALCERDDGWLEIELGEFYCDGVNDRQVTMCLREIKGELICEELPVEMCALSIASDGKRCVLESRASDEGNLEVECQTSEAFASNKMLQEYIETDECVGACGVDRQTLGLSSDALLDSKFITKLCSHHCYNNCPNIIDLYSNVASAEGLSLAKMCSSKKTRPRRGMSQSASLSSGAAAPVVSGGGAAGPVSAADPPVGSDPIPDAAAPVGSDPINPDAAAPVGSDDPISDAAPSPSQY